jgi:RNA polymerase sigma factor (sigma-70 family)
MPPDLSDLCAILDRYERPLIRYALSIVGDLEAARDIVQETFIAWSEGRGPKQHTEEPIHRSNGASDSPHSENLSSRTPEQRHLEAWLFTVCRNRAIDHQRKQSRIIPMYPIDDRTSDEPGPAAVLESREIAGSLLRLLDKLSANQREVIRLKFQNELSYKEIADVTQLSVTNVGFLLHTGLKKLRSLVLEQPGDFPLPARQSL